MGGSGNPRMGFEEYMSEKIYIPKANAREQQGQYGSFIKLGFNAAELIAFANQHKNDRGYLNLILSPRRNPDDRATHSIYLDTYKPKEGREGFQQARAAANAAKTPEGIPANPHDDSVPF